ncbi:hypothetical protein PUN28_003376 [Cardiocondyla obscurior]|uniref:Secreted protein n=1 Tax=Cardiocondyla obscurior TaxID=286306 RepID=A0AAW2GLY9_9HYME
MCNFLFANIFVILRYLWRVVCCGILTKVAHPNNNLKSRVHSATLNKFCLITLDEGGGSTKPVIKVPSHEHGYLTLKLRRDGTGRVGLNSHSARAAQSLLRIYFRFFSRVCRKIHKSVCFF